MSSARFGVTPLIQRLLASSSSSERTGSGERHFDPEEQAQLRDGAKTASCEEVATARKGLARMHPPRRPLGTDPGLASGHTDPNWPVDHSQPVVWGRLDEPFRRELAGALAAREAECVRHGRVFGVVISLRRDASPDELKRARTMAKRANEVGAKVVELKSGKSLDRRLNDLRNERWVEFESEGWQSVAAVLEGLGVTDLVQHDLEAPERGIVRWFRLHAQLPEGKWTPR